MHPVIGSALLALGACLLLVVAAVRLVPVGSRAVVTRFGKVTKVQDAGLAVVLPGVDRLTQVVMTPRRVEPVSTTACTRDGFDLRLIASVLWQVQDPTATLHASPDIGSVTQDVVERWLHHVVADADLVTLLEAREEVLASARPHLDALAGAIGVTVLDVDLQGVEIRAGSELLRLLR
jgi:regulator of protease activity HflC (stomatin/prohibitin superfamily)